MELEGLKDFFSYLNIKNLQFTLLFILTSLIDERFPSTPHIYNVGIFNEMI